MNHNELSYMAGAVDDSTINIVVVIIIIIIIIILLSLTLQEIVFPLDHCNLLVFTFSYTDSDSIS